MPIKVAVDGAMRLGSRVWLVELGPEDLRVLGATRAPLGEVSVILLPMVPPPDEECARIDFEPGTAQFLNVGRSSESIIIFGGQMRLVPADVEEIPKQVVGPRVQHDDEAFLKELEALPSEVMSAGMEIFTTLRREAKGYFQRYGSGVYVNRPDNFWTVKVQPRDESIRVTVRGTPEEYEGYSTLDVKDDQRGYSRFKVLGARQVSDAIRLLLSAARRASR